MGKKKPYLPNNWDEYKNADDDAFIPHTFEEIMSWKVAGWELPASVVCIIRKTDIETKKTVEYTYSRRTVLPNVSLMSLLVHLALRSQYVITNKSTSFHLQND
jgi:hypothetical protein